jgi:hypothetical protein
MNTKPFHESVVDAIKNCPGPREEALDTLGTIGNLIINTTIPANHENIWVEFKNAVEYWSDKGQTKDMRGLLFKVEVKLTEEKA